MHSKSQHWLYIMSGQLQSPAAFALVPAPSTHWIGGWVGLRPGLVVVARRKKSLPCLGVSNPD